ncbi:WD repeat protein DCAF11/LEC14B protein [Dioscorea alata]|uniref:WD repeat protein DCAF11/LEC14B protein n=1 Tax=Dioscorea alata TaxID=55571 RepID=A0ACB7V0V0_DIOAL|nr:WD repeat protein DCAF11/LEC14B protein [Dioscorea alata]
MPESWRAPRRFLALIAFKTLTFIAPGAPALDPNLHRSSVIVPIESMPIVEQIMAYAMRKLKFHVDECDGGESSGEAVLNQKHGEPADSDHEIFHLTKLRSEPSEALRKSTHGSQSAPVSTVKMLLGREANYSGRGKFSSADCSHVLGRYLPVNGPWHVDRMDSRAYVSQFSEDGSLFVAGFQGSHIKIYDVENGWKVRKNILAKSLRWTITDTSLSPDQHYLVYSSMSPIIHIVNVGSESTESYANINDIHDGLDMSCHDDGAYSFGIFSVKFSTDGRELVAGSSDDSIYVYDLEENKLTLRIPAHSSDVNTVTFADESGHIIYSGSDDHLCKVWDRRCFNTREQAAGVLTGHLQGITFIDSRGDGRYFISNGKDQGIKLWDIRRMSSEADCSGPRISSWDYRWMEYPAHAKHLRHPSDQSLATYQGHSVLRTLIRCYFSPAYSTGQRYIYTGSSDNCVYIYDVVTGELVSKLDNHYLTVRDCSWHPYYPTLVSSSWDGLVARWEFSSSVADPSLVKKNSRIVSEDSMFNHIFL